MFKEYSLEDWAELPQTKFADSQPSSRAGRPESLVELSANEGRLKNPNRSGGKVCNEPKIILNKAKCYNNSASPPLVHFCVHTFSLYVE